MKNKLAKVCPILICLIGFLMITSSARAQLSPYYISPYWSNYSYPFWFCSFLPPMPPAYTNPFAAYGRIAHAPLTSSSLFPAPVLPAVPAATTGGVGLTSLIPLFPVTVSLPATVLITNPLAGLITFTPLSLVGLTFAPVPVVPTTPII